MMTFFRALRLAYTSAILLFDLDIPVIARVEWVREGADELCWSNGVGMGHKPRSGYDAAFGGSGCAGTIDDYAFILPLRGKDDGVFFFYPAGFFQFFQFFQFFKNPGFRAFNIKP